MFKKIALIVALTCASTGLDQYAAAQNTRLPDISVRQDLESEFDPDIFNPNNFSEIYLDNEYLRSKIELQYQMTLINSLRDWLARASSIVQAYQNINMQYTPPKPPQALCEQIPVNVLCYNSYPDLYPQAKEFLKERQKQDVLMSIQTEDVAISEIAGIIGDLEIDKPALEKALAPRMEKSKFKPQYEWVEVFCVGGECQGVVSDKDSPTDKLTVTMGDELPDGSMISKIQPGRVEVRKGKDVFILNPAPLDGMRTSEPSRSTSRAESRSLSPSRERAPIGNSNTPSPSQQQAAPSSSSSTNNDDAGADDDLPALPLLGETGLF